MKSTFRQSMSWLHTWVGLLSGWVLFFVFVTGSAAYFRHEITRWMKPELPLRTETRRPPAAAMAETAVSYLARQPEAARSWSIALPQDGGRMGCGPQCGGSLRGYQSNLTVSWAGNSERLDSVTGEELPPQRATRDTEGGDLFFEMHQALYYLDRRTGELIVAISAMAGLLALVTGIVVHKKIFKDFFTFRPGKGQRSWLDAHNVVGVTALPFFVMIIYSGLTLQGYMPEPLLAVPGAQKRPAPPVEETSPVTRPSVPMTQIVEQAEKLLGPGEIGSISLGQPAGQGPQIEVSRPWGVEYPFAAREGSFLHFDATTGALLDIPFTKGQAPAHKALW
jgi:uncharacterized iron-regulated membrane protein